MTDLKSTTNLKEQWDKILTDLRRQMTGAMFNITLQGTHLLSAENGTWQIGVQNDMTKELL